MFPGETILTGADQKCSECSIEYIFTVLHSAAGYYIGTHCFCGPNTRETKYFETNEQAKDALDIYMAGGQLPGRRQ